MPTACPELGRSRLPHHPRKLNRLDELEQQYDWEEIPVIGRIRCAVWVRTDALLTADAVATPDMLCWGVDCRALVQRIALGRG